MVVVGRGMVDLVVGLVVEGVGARDEYIILSIDTHMYTLHLQILLF